MTLPGARRLAIFARVPVAGRVKSRLAASIGDAAARDAHVALAEAAFARVEGLTGVVTELWTDGPPDERVRRWAQRWAFVLRQQEGGDLGARMAHALDGQAQVPAGREGAAAPMPVVLIGTDCPLIDRGYVERAFAALERHALVLGPAADGGFGLIGWTRPVPGLFDGVTWGRADVLAETLRNAIAAGVHICLLPEIWDVDDLAGWQRWLAEQAARSVT